MKTYEEYEALKKEYVEEWYGEGYDPDDFVLYDVHSYKELGEMLFEEEMFVGIEDWVANYLDYEKLGRDYYLESDAVICEGGFLFYYG